MRRLVALITLTFLLIGNMVHAQGLDVSSKASIVIDGATGRVLYGKNIYEKLSMASTTKIMTSIVALENSHLNDLIKVSPHAAHVEGSSIWLEENEQISMENALYGLMLESGNDAATAIAEFVAKDEDKFADMMNKKAKEIGAPNTSFTNPHGLDNIKHYTTAYDLAQITRYGLQNPKFAEIVKTKERKIPWQEHSYNRLLKNHNRLLWTYPFADGVKTGFTKKSGRCLVSSATKDGWQLVCVTLKASDDWNIHKDLFDYVFNKYKPKILFNENQYIKTAIVSNGKKDRVTLVTDSKLNVPLLPGEEEKIKYVYNVTDSVEAPISKDKKVGSVDVYIDSQKIASIGLVPSEFIDRTEPVKGMGKVFKNWLLMFNGEDEQIK